MKNCKWKIITHNLFVDLPTILWIIASVSILCAYISVFSEYSFKEDLTYFNYLFALVISWAFTLIGVAIILFLIYAIFMAYNEYLEEKCN